MATPDFENNQKDVSSNTHDIEYCTTNQLEKCSSQKGIESNLIVCDDQKCKLPECPIGHKYIIQQGECLRLFRPLCRPSEWDSEVCWKHISGVQIQKQTDADLFAIDIYESTRSKVNN